MSDGNLLQNTETGEQCSWLYWEREGESESLNGLLVVGQARRQILQYCGSSFSIGLKVHGCCYGSTFLLTGF